MKWFSNIDFYKESAREKKTYRINDFEIPEDVSYIVCPNKVKSTEYKVVISKDDKEYKNWIGNTGSPTSCSNALILNTCNNNELHAVY